MMPNFGGRRSHVGILTPKIRGFEWNRSPRQELPTYRGFAIGVAGAIPEHQRFTRDNRFSSANPQTCGGRWSFGIACPRPLGQVLEGHSRTGDSGVEPQAKGNLTQIEWIHAARRLAVIPSAYFGREHHPPGSWFECKPPGRIGEAAIEFHFEYLHAWESTSSPAPHSALRNRVAKKGGAVSPPLFYIAFERTTRRGVTGYLAQSLANGHTTDASVRQVPRQMISVGTLVSDNRRFFLEAELHL